jgi:hypothetical protein
VVRVAVERMRVGMAAAVDVLMTSVGPAVVVLAGGAGAQARPVGVAVAGGVEVTPA